MPPQARIIDADSERFVFLDSQWLALCERALGRATEIPRLSNLMSQESIAAGCAA